MNKAMVYDGKDLKVVEWSGNSYKFINTHVGGYIEHVVNETLEEKHIDLWCNEDGKFMGLEPTLALTMNGRVYDIVVGNVVLTKVDKNGNTKGLSSKDIEFIKDVFNKCEFVIYNDNKHIQKLRCLNYRKEV